MRIGGWPNDVQGPAIVTPGWMMHLPAGLGKEARKRLCESCSSLDELRSKQASEIEFMLHKNPPIGAQVKRTLQAMPQLQVDVYMRLDTAATKSPSTDPRRMQLEVNLSVDCISDSSTNLGRGWQRGYVLLAGFIDGELLRHERFDDCKNLQHSTMLDIIVPSDTPQDAKLQISFVSERYRKTIDL